MAPNPNDVQLGPATPDQAQAAAQLIFDTDPALWNCLFSNDRQSAVRFFEEEWQEERSLFGYTLCTAATLGNALMGIELGFDRATMREYEGGTGPRGYACLSLKGLETYQRYDAYLRYLSPSIPDDVYYIEFLSIAPRARGRGLGRRLLEQAFTRAKQAGHRACELDVSSDNLAVAFYRRMGMELLSESRVVPLEKRGVHSHYRMIKTPL